VTDPEILKGEGGTRKVEKYFYHFQSQILSFTNTDLQILGNQNGRGPLSKFGIEPGRT
jgi:hypothetical protein